MSILKARVTNQASAEIASQSGNEQTRAATNAPGRRATANPLLNVLASYGPRSAGALTRSELYTLLEQSGFKDVDMVGLPMFGITAITACKA